MTSPSWLPAWPATWTDFEAAYRRIVPTEWPRNLFAYGSNAIKDLQATGEALAQVRKLIEWVLRRVWPSEDSGGLFLARWEEALGISPAQSIAWRQWWIRAIFGLQAGTLDYNKCRRILAGAYGSDLYTEVTAISTNPTVVATFNPGTPYQWAFCQTNVHWHSTGEDVNPDDRLARWLLSLITPAGALWSYGRYSVGVYDDDLLSLGSAGRTYGHCVYDTP